MRTPINTSRRSRLDRGTASTKALAALGAFMTRAGRLPGFAQRRLDALIAKNKSEGLTKAENRELSEALEYVDRKSIFLLQQFAKARR